MYGNESSSYGQQPPDAAEEQCDAEGLDDLTCRAKGRAEQAKYDAAFEKELAAARASYDAARNDYRTARQNAMSTVQDLRHQVERTIARLRCLIKRKEVWQSLEEACRRVVDDLNRCSPPVGCAALMCDYTVDDVDDLPWEDVVARITVYQQAVDEAKSAFTALIAEPGELAKRVTAIQQVVTEIKGALDGKQGEIDNNLLYARALVAQRDLNLVWKGFAQSKDFLDCLCRTLTCWSTGLDAVSALTGAKAVAECKRQSEKARCDRLQTHTAEEILAVFDRICPPRRSDDSTAEQYESEDGYEERDENHGQHQYG